MVRRGVGGLFNILDGQEDVKGWSVRFFCLATTTSVQR